MTLSIKKTKLVMFIVVIAMLADEIDAKRKKRYCRYISKSNRCVDTLPVKHRRLPNVCKASMLRRCAATGGRCVHRYKRNGKVGCACVEFHDL